MTKTVVIFHSGYGHTKVVAEHVAAGAKADLIAISPEGDISEEDWTALDAADAIVFGAPTYMGSASWQFKKFSDATSKRWFTRDWSDKVFGGFTNSASPSGDKQVSLIQMQTLASQHGGIWVSLGQAPSNAKASTSADLNNLGGSVGLMVRSPSDASVDEVHSGDLASARLYGERVAAIAAKLKA
ncbi:MULTISPECIES: flavodoxin family protein [unclassified Novosphingobium]|uniref:flavodoxin family protein n=1 Tax=unclassified Novosphingobium TaxID=2644732 RepID=UPI000EE1450F|nr:MULTISPECIES: flavodoxin family protein [unclassified Novosphingobium]HCF24173.1 NADPH-dependent FMN reductase [Novosphingobium sp.]HQV02134.1 flavodoxin family protein [Novosphingobium sp.]